MHRIDQHNEETRPVTARHTPFRRGRVTSLLRFGCCIVLVLLALPSALAAPGSPVAPFPQAYLPLILRPAPPVNPLDLALSSATYLGGPAADRVSAAAVAPDGTLLVAGAFPGYSPPGIVPTAFLPPPRDGQQAPLPTGAILRLSPTGTELLSMTRVLSPVLDMEAAGQRLAACGEFGLALLDATSGTPQSLSSDPATRCSIGADGAVATLGGGFVQRYDASGGLTPAARWQVAGAADLAVDAANQQVVVTGYTQKDRNLKVAWVRAYAYDGTLRWTAYDFAKEAAFGAGLAADSEGRRLTLGADGLLYLAGWTDGGNSIFTRDPQNIATKLPATVLVKTDAYNDPYGLSGAKSLAFVARLDPASGSLQQAQIVLTRLVDGKGNSLTIKAIAADAQGRVFVAGDTACCIKNRNGNPGAAQVLTVAGATIGNYESGEAFFLALSADFKTRLAWSVFAAAGNSAGGSPAEALAVGSGKVAIGATLNVKAGTQRALITYQALQPQAAALSEGYLAVWPLP